MVGITAGDSSHDEKGSFPLATASGRGRQPVPRARNLAGKQEANEGALLRDMITNGAALDNEPRARRGSTADHRASHSSK